MTSPDRPVPAGPLPGVTLSGLTLRRYGERAWLIEVDPDEVAALARSLEAVAAAEFSGVIEEIVPAAATVLVTVTEPSDLSRVRQRMAGPLPQVAPDPETDTVEIPVTYDGPDLEAVAEMVGLSPSEVIQRHVDSAHWVQFCGFSPGFGYLAGLDVALEVGRRPSPRPRVPPGSVSIAGRYSAVYPTASPGGWHLIGRTDVTLFDPAWFDEGRAPLLFRPGVAVRFRDVGGTHVEPRTAPTADGGANQ